MNFEVTWRGPLRAGRSVGHYEYRDRWFLLRGPDGEHMGLRAETHVA